MRALYVTHPQVQIAPKKPVPHWSLSDIGYARATAFAARQPIPKGATIFSSDETKALELAEILAASIHAPVFSDEHMGENDRSATGFLPPAQFEATANRFFAQPEASIDGWERAIDAQRRIVAAVSAAVAKVPDGRLAVFCGHGAVGTLLKCHVAGRPIARREDQGHSGNPGGGNCFVFDLAAGVLHSEWSALEDQPTDWHLPA